MSKKFYTLTQGSSSKKYFEVATSFAFTFTDNSLKKSFTMFNVER